MGLLERRVVLVTDTEDPLGRAMAYAIAEAGAAVVVNDARGAGTSASAADEMVRSLRRRGAVAALASYASLRDFRATISMLRAGFDKWDWVSGILHVCREGDDLATLHNLLRAAAPQMKEWGGTLAVLNASPEAAGVIAAQADALREGRLYANAVRPGSPEAVESMALFLMSTLPISARLSGQYLPPQPNLSPNEINERLDEILQQAAAAPPAAAADPDPDDGEEAGEDVDSDGGEEAGGGGERSERRRFWQRRARPAEDRSPRSKDAPPSSAPASAQPPAASAPEPAPAPAPAPEKGRGGKKER